MWRGLVLFVLTTWDLSVAARSAGILYEVWHAKAAAAMAQVRAAGLEELTTELVIRSDGQKTLNDVYSLRIAPILTIFGQN